MKIRKLIEMPERTKPIDFNNPKDIEYLLKWCGASIYNSGIVMEINEKRFADIEKRLEKLEKGLDLAFSTLKNSIKLFENNKLMRNAIDKRLEKLEKKK